MSVGRFRLFQRPQIAGEPDGEMYQADGGAGQLERVLDAPALVNYHGAPLVRNSGLFEIGLPLRPGGSFGVGLGNSLPLIAHMMPMPTELGATIDIVGGFDAIAPMKRYETGATDTNTAGVELLSAPGGSLYTSWLPQVTMTLKPSSLTNCAIWAGLAWLQPAAGSSAPDTDYIGYRYFTGTDTNWAALTMAATVATTIDTGVAVAASTIKLGFRVLSINLVEFWIATTAGWTKVGESTTNIPAFNVALSPFVVIYTREAATKELFFSEFSYTRR